MLWIALLFFNLLESGVSDELENANLQREELLRKEINMMLGNDILLNDSEKKANDIIMNLKHTEMDYGFKYPGNFNYSKHFFEYKDIVKKSKLFKFIKEMPKGAVLHAHDTAILGPDYVLQLTYKDNLFVCFEDSSVRFLFATGVPSQACTYEWQLMKKARYSSGDIRKFDVELRKNLTLVVNNPVEEYTDINVIWFKFTQYFISTAALFTYKPVWEQYFYDVLKALRDDNIMYLEIRSNLPTLYDLKGNEYDSLETAKCYKKVLNQFLQDYPDFFGVKLIYAPTRLVDNKGIKNYLETAILLKQELPDFFAGFDLVGQEDLGLPTKEFFKELSKASNHLNYFFHAGETNWCGSSSDENLFDVIALGTKRIGHAYALIKHPLLIQEIKKRDIALEVNVVSNVVLKLVSDIRNHPLAAYLAQNLPVIISSDDPGLWEADPLSHDYYVTFLGVASRHADLKLLKKLALNSIYYSSYHNKDKMVQEFEIRWTKFVNKVVKTYMC